MTAKPWLHNGKMLAQDGHPALCSECPCTEGGCNQAVDAEVLRYLAMVDPATQRPLWTLKNTYTTDYVCAQWRYDALAQTWSLVSQASGHLLVALRREGTIGDTLSSNHLTLTYAKTLQNINGEYLTIGCRCHVTDHVCQHYMEHIDDYDIAGRLSVYHADDPDDYTPNDGCRVDTCPVALLKIDAAHRWHGGTKYGEGYWDWWTSASHTRSNYAYIKYLAALYDSGRGDHGYLYYVPCECDSTSIQSHECTAGEQRHEMSGICAMDGDCVLSMQLQLRTYLDQQYEESTSESSYVPLWEHVATVITDYECMVTRYSSETRQYDILKPATGHMVVSYRRTGIQTNYLYDYLPLIHATTVRNRQTGAYRTFGCSCNYSTTGECYQRLVDNEGYCIGGVMPLKPYEESASESVYPSSAKNYACSVSACDAYRLMLSCYVEWYGGRKYGEGYVDVIDSGTHAYSYRKFAGLYVITMDGERYYMQINCDCENTYIYGLYAYKMGADDIVHEATGICANPDCERLLILRQSAQENGWTWHNEGVIIHKAYSSAYIESVLTYVWGDWYRYEDKQAYLGCAESSDCLYYVTCSCSGITTIHKDRITEYTQPVEDIPADFRMCIEYSGACSCVDNRELLLLYPDIFGVLDIAYGTHAKYHWTREGGTSGYEVTGNRYSTGYVNCLMYLDYRSFCWVGKVFSGMEQRVYVRRISPDGSPAGNIPASGGYDRLYLSAQFVGHAVPFAHDDDINWDWAGFHYQWSGVCGNAPDDYCYDTRDKAADACASYVPTQGCSACGLYAYDIPLYAPRVSPPDHTVSYHAGRIVYKEGARNPWCCKIPYYAIGQVYEIDGRDWEIVYREQWIETNKGLLRYQVGDYLPSLTLYGIRGDHGDPSWRSCYTHSTVPYNDTTITSQIVDDDMHGCPGHDVDWGFESESI